MLLWIMRRALIIVRVWMWCRNSLILCRILLRFCLGETIFCFRIWWKVWRVRWLFIGILWKMKAFLKNLETLFWKIRGIWSMKTFWWKWDIFSWILCYRWEFSLFSYLWGSILSILCLHLSIFRNSWLRNYNKKKKNLSHFSKKFTENCTKKG